MTEEERQVQGGQITISGGTTRDKPSQLEELSGEPSQGTFLEEEAGRLQSDGGKGGKGKREDVNKQESANRQEEEH